MRADCGAPGQIVMRTRKLTWDVFWGALAVAAVLLAIPLVRPEIDKLFHVPAALYLAVAVAGLALGAVAVIGIAVLLVALAFGRSSTWCEIRPVSKRDVKPVFELMKHFFGEETPSRSRMLEWQRRNKTVLTAVYAKKLRGGRTTQRLVGVFKVLPLTPQAVALFESEQLTGATLSANHIAAEGEKVAALYIGDVAASTHQGKAEVLRQLKHAVELQLKPGASVYTRPLTADGIRLVRKYNFIPVMNEVLPGSAGRIHKLIAGDDILPKK
jgi:hypothetical protein